MFQQLFKKVLPYVPKYHRLNQIIQFSNDSIKDKSNDCETPNTDQSMKTSSQTSYDTQEVLHLLQEAATFQDANDKSWTTSPYPADVPLNHNEEKTKQKIDPSNTFVLLFPGQGTIKVGMIRKYIKYPVAKELFDIANEIINYDLLKLCLNGPQEKLNRTEFNQAATVISSLAALEKIRSENPRVFESCVATAGYSVGEITALILSGAINFEDGIRLAWARGKAMQIAADKVPQGMIAVSHTPKGQVSKACQEAENWAINLGVENPVCRIAIYLHTEKKILGGNIETLTYIENNATQFGLTNLSKLPVSGAFHTPLMEPALKSVSKALSSIEINEPRCKVYSNYKGVPYSNLQFMKKYILKQIVSPVKWEQCLHSIYSRSENTPFPQTYDVASNGRMRSILRLVNAKASRSCIVI